jgi:hypothetical protein
MYFRVASDPVFRKGSLLAFSAAITARHQRFEECESKCRLKNSMAPVARVFKVGSM